MSAAPTLATVPALGDLVLPDDAGTPTVLRSLWAERPVVLAFVRHWG